MRISLLATAMILGMITAPIDAANAAAATSNQAAIGYNIETVAEGLEYPWSIAFLPNGDYLVALRVGEVRRINAAGRR